MHRVINNRRIKEVISLTGLGTAVKFLINLLHKLSFVKYDYDLFFI